MHLLQRMIWLPWLQVSLFVELFNEMLVRDFAFCIYKALLACPDKAEDDKKQDDDRKKSSDKKNDSKKRDEKKCDKASADQHHSSSVEVKKETNKDWTGDAEIKPISEVFVAHSLSATFTC